jgi:hypothetical protein
MKSLRRRSDPGLPIPFSVWRGRREFTLKSPLSVQGLATYGIEKIKSASELAQRVRQRWLEGTTSPSAGSGKR